MPNLTLRADRKQYITIQYSGDVGEALWDIGYKIIRKNMISYFQYLYKNRDSNLCLEKVFTDAISVQINMARERGYKKEEIFFTTVQMVVLTCF